MVNNKTDFFLLYVFNKHILTIYRNEYYSHSIFVLDTITPLGSFIEFFCEEATDVIVITDSRLSLADLHRDIPSTSREKLHVIPYDAFVTPEPMEDFEFIEWDELELLE